MKRDKKRSSGSRDRSIRTRKKDIKINRRTNNRQIQKKSSSRRRKNKRKVYIRRRIFLLTILIILIVLLAKLVYSYFNRYDNYSYPSFRQEVLESITNEVYVGSTNGRSLTTAEKVDDFNKLHKIFEKNYAVTNENEKDYIDFLDSYNKYKDKVKNSKTDQEYFELLVKYLNLLKNTRIKIIDKASYNDLLNYYKNSSDTIYSRLIQHPQSIDRYKRIIGENEDLEKAEFTVSPSNVLIIELKNFALANLKNDIEAFNQKLIDNPGITKIIINLSDNSSINSHYWQEFSQYLLHSDYKSSRINFYRGDLLGFRLNEIKENESEFKTSYVKNPASKYPSKIDDINLNNYMYYDEVTLNLFKDKDYSNRNIYVLVNDYTANEAIKFASVLKENTGAKIIKNGLETQNSANDIIHHFPADYFVLDHSGLLISIDNSYSIDSENKYLNYDQFINSNNPVESILSSI